MNKSKICEALYTLPGGVIVKRRKSLLIPVVLLLAGAAMLILNQMYGALLTNNLQSALVFVGGTLAIAGFVVTVARLIGSGGVPFHRGEKKCLEYQELYFDRKFLPEVVRCVEQGDVETLGKLEHSSVPAVTVALYRTPDSCKFAAMQVFEYVELEYRPLSEMRIVTN